MKVLAKAASAVVTERTLAFLSAPIDALMITTLVLWGPLACFIVGCVLDFVFAVFVLELHLQTKRRGFDVTAITDIRAWILAPVERIPAPTPAEWPLSLLTRARTWQRFVAATEPVRKSMPWRLAANAYFFLRYWTLRPTKWVLRLALQSYWMMIIFGSPNPVIESDYATLFLIKEGESRLSVLLRVTLPAVLWSIGVWTLIYWMGVAWIERILM